MTTLAIRSGVEHRGAAVREIPTAPEHLDLLAESIRLAPRPAFFAVWQDGPDSMRLFVDVLIQAGLTTPHVIRPDNLAAKLVTLGQRSWADDDGIIFLGCLNALSEEEGRQFNAARDRLLSLSTRMIFVESVADEGKIRLAFPDVLSQVSYDCRLFLRAGEEDPFEALQGGPSAIGKEVEGVPNAAELSGEILQVGETDALCWLEVSPGVRVKFQVPLNLLQHLRPRVGQRFLWSPATEGQPVQFRERKPEPPDHQLLEEIERLSRDFREDVRHKPFRVEGDA